MAQDLDVLESSKSKKTKRGLCALLQELSDDEANVTDSHLGVSEDPDQSWSPHFWAHMNVSKQVPDGWSAIKW